MKNPHRISHTLPHALFSLLMSAIALGANAAVTLPSLFVDHMVLQRDQPVPVWGKAAPGEKVTIAFASQTVSATADAAGLWRVALAPMSASVTPRDMVITSVSADSSKNENLKIQDILIGDVWLCSGQSNMSFMLMNAKTGKADIAASTNASIRLFDVSRAVAQEPQFTCKGKWAPCGPDSVAKFTAVGYYFGRQLLADNPNVPIGLIHSSWGGTSAEAWTPRATLAADPVTNTILTKWAEIMRKFPKMKADFEANKDKLMTKWKADAEKAKAAGHMPPAEPRLRTGPNTQYEPAGLYNAMITPLAPFAMRGIIWYQGEGNAGHPIQYRTLFPAMIKSWRTLWQRNDLPFLFVQLPNLDRQPEPSKSGWAEIREAQLRTLALPHTAMAVTIDVGDPKNLHPTNKQPVGQRLAYAAEALFGERAPATAICPYLAKYAAKGREITVTLSPSTITLKTRDGAAPRGFKIAGADKNFVPAQARIEGNTAVIWSDDIAAPVSVRYAWADNPDCNVTSAADLPLSPFRTDNWPTLASESEVAAATTETTASE